MYLESDTLLLADVYEKFGKKCLKIYELDPVKFLSTLGLAWQAALKKTEVKLELSTEINMLLMVEKRIRGGICHVIHQYAKADNKYLNDYDKIKEPSHLKYWDVNNLYGWAMSQKLLVNNFERIGDTSQFDEDFIKNYNEESDKGYPEKLHELHNDLPFLTKVMKTEKVEKLVANLHDKTKYVIYIRNLNQVLSHGLTLKKMYRVIQFNQKASLNPYIDMNTKLRQEAKHNFEKDFFKLMNNAIFGRTMENVRKHRNIKLVTTERRGNYLVSEPKSYYKFFHKKFISNRNEKKT